MRTTVRLRVAALAAAVALPLAGLMAAAPAQAAEVPAPVIELDVTTFPAGDWGAGFHVTGTGFVGTGDVTLGIGANGPDGGGSIYQITVPAVDGAIDLQVTPYTPTSAPDAAGYPRYFVYASQANGDQSLFANQVDLTITAGASLTAPAEVTPAQVTEGFPATFAGFAPGEEVVFYFDILREGDLIETFEGTAVADESGAGTITGAVAGSQIGDYIEVYAWGVESDRVAQAFAQVVEALAPAPAPAPAPAAPAASGPKLAETGVDLTIGLAAAGLLVLGAAGIVVRRRFATR